MYSWVHICSVRVSVETTGVGFPVTCRIAYFDSWKLSAENYVGTATLGVDFLVTSGMASPGSSILSTEKVGVGTPYVTFPVTCLISSLGLCTLNTDYVSVATIDVEFLVKSNGIPNLICAKYSFNAFSHILLVVLQYFKTSVF